MRAPGGTLWGFPKGVFLLSFTELWERFSYYGMLALLVLFLTASNEAGGFAWERDGALKLYGFYTGIIFTMPLLGGWIANQSWGERRCIAVGGLLLMLGNACLACASAPLVARAADGSVITGVEALFFGGLILVALGTGLLKPTISSIVGRFYDDGDKRRDAAFSVFFVGIYIGSMCAGLVAGFLGERVAWHWGFGSAAVGMALGMVAYLLKQQAYLQDIGRTAARRLRGTRAALSIEERNRIKVILFQGLFTVAYAAAFFQKGGLLTLFAREHLDRSVGGWEVPVTWLLSISTATFIVATPITAYLWQRLEARGRNPSASTKLAWGLFALALGYLTIASVAPALGEIEVHRPSWTWLALTYVCFGIGDALVWPIQISMVSRLAPSHLSATLVGGWYITIGLGSWLTGYIGTLDRVIGLQGLFLALAVALTMLAALLWSQQSRLRRQAGGLL